MRARLYSDGALQRLVEPELVGQSAAAKKNASTTTGENWVPRPARTSASASSEVSARW
jgi:hypothetical protein